MLLAPSDSGVGVPASVVTPSATVITHSKRVLIALPWQKQVSPVTAFCVAQLIDRRRTASMMHHGDAFVAHSRNSMADAFLASDCEWMLSIDDDMVVPFGHSEWFSMNSGFVDFPEWALKLNALDRLMSHHVTLVGALYFGRHRNGPPVYNEGANPVEADFARKAPHDTIKPTRWVGTGCMLVHRSVFEDIEKKFPDLARTGPRGGNWFSSTEASLKQDVQVISEGLTNGGIAGDGAYRALGALSDALARARFENPLGTGEDVSFCLRAKAAGHQPYVDLGLVCGHIGYCVYGPRNTSNK